MRTKKIHTSHIQRFNMMTTIAFVCLLSTWAASPPGVTSQLNQVIPTRRRVEYAAKLNHDPDVPVGASVAKAVEVQVSMSMYSILCMSISPSFTSTDIEGIVFDVVDDVPIESVDAKTTVASSSSKTTKSPAAKSDKRPVASPAAKAAKRPTTTHSAKATKGPVASPTAKTNKSTTKSSPIETEHIEWLPIVFLDPDDVQVGASVAKAVEVQVSMSMHSILCMSISPSFTSTDIEGIVFDVVDDVPIESVDAKTTVASSSSKTTKSPAAKSDKRPVASPAAKAAKRPTTTHSAKATKGPVAKSSPIETEIVVNEVPIETPAHGTKIDIDQVTHTTKLTQLPHTNSAKAEKVFKSKTAKSV